MIVEFDCGNSRIKWRILGAETGEVLATNFASGASDFCRQLASFKARVVFCRGCSVRGERFDLELTGQIRTVLGLQPVFARSARQLAGVINAYESPGMLGVDRWLALVAGYNSCGCACVVVDCGTAITVDFVDSCGQHLGGLIAPGLQLLQAALSEKTALPQVSTIGELKPAQNTQAAMGAGVGSMYAGFLLSQKDLAERVFSAGYKFILTGGDAVQAQRTVPDAVIRSELVFSGLALACPFGG